MNEELNKALSGFKTDIINAFKDTRNVEVNEQVSNLESKVAELNSKVTELNATIEEKDKEIEELNKKCEEANAEADKKDEEAKNKEDELNSAIAEKDAELNTMKKERKVAELNQALSSFTDEEKKCAEAEINAFNEDPFSVEINSITTKIEAASYRKMREDQKTQNSEINSIKDEFDGIISAVDPIHKNDSSIEDFDDCFA